MFFKIIGENKENEPVILYTNIFKISKDIPKFLEENDIVFFFKVNFGAIKKSNLKKYLCGSYIEKRY